MIIGGLLALAVLVLAFLVFTPQVPQAILAEETTIIDWNGISVKVTSALGSFTTNKTLSFCNDNSGDVSISNSIITQDNIIAQSSISTIEKACVKGQPIQQDMNRILMEMTLPSGTLLGDCSTSHSETRGTGQLPISICSIQVNGTRVEEGQKIQIINGSYIEIELITETGDIATSFEVYSNIDISFTEDEPECTIDSDCDTNEVCTNEVCVEDVVVDDTDDNTTTDDGDTTTNTTNTTSTDDFNVDSDDFELNITNILLVIIILLIVGGAIFFFLRKSKFIK